MSLIAMGSLKASPGVTTTALALALSWAEPVVVVEADPDGGDLAARLRLAPNPDLTDLATASRHGHVDAALLSRAQRIEGHTSLVVGPSSAHEALTALRGHAPMGEALSGAPSDVLVDCGRLGPTSASSPLAEHAELIVMVARPRIEEIAHLVPRVEALAAAGHRTALVLVGDHPYPPEEVAAVVDTPLLGVIDDDPRGAAALNGGAGAKALRRSLLLRSAATVAERIRRFVEADVTGPARPNAAHHAEAAPTDPHPDALDLEVYQ